MRNKDYVKEAVYGEGFSEEELFAEYGPEKNAEGLLPLFIRTMLEEETTPGRKLTQEKIRCKLDRYPYSLSPDIKTVYRAVNTLAKEYAYIRKNRDDGVYYDRRRVDSMVVDDDPVEGSANSRKSLLPLFIQDVLERKTDRCHRFTQKQILCALEEGPHGITAGRKAVAGWLDMMTKEEVCHVCGDSRHGYWYDEKYFTYDNE